MAANDWASTDPTKNIACVDYETFRAKFDGVFGVYIDAPYIQSSTGTKVPYADVRATMPHEPVNVCVDGGPAMGQINIAQFVAEVRAAANLRYPIGYLFTMFAQMFPNANNLATTISNWPEVQEVVAAKLKTL